MTQPVPAGWYPDPENPAQQRYWDGAAWTQSVAPVTPPQPAVQPPSTSAHAAAAIGVGAKGAVESALGFVEGQQKRREDRKRQEQEAAEAAAKAAAERTRIQNEKMLAFVRRYWKALLAVLAVLVLVIAIGAWRESRDQAVANTAAMPESAADLKGDDYQDVKARLQDAGFTSIETTAMPDLIVGWLTKDGEVEEVSVNGETGYGAGSEFPKDATVVIRYHTFPEEEPQAAAEGSSVESEPPEAAAEEPDDTILTPRNNKELAAALKSENPGDPQVQAFIQKYAGRTIEFDGYTLDWANHTSTSPFSGEEKTYDTLFDTNIYVGNVKNAGTSSVGPTFRVESFSMPNYSPAVNRQNVHVKAKVDGYDADHEFFRISVISLEDR